MRGDAILVCTRIAVLAMAAILSLAAAPPVSGSKEPGSVALRFAAGAAAVTVTVSGTIRHGGSPVSGVAVNVSWTSGGQVITTESDGAYSVTGVPTGGHVVITVQPPVADRLSFRSWSTDSLAGDMVKDFSLEDGYLVSGEIRKPDGTPYDGSALEIRSIDLILPAGESFPLGLGAGGNFQTVVPQGYYAILTAPELAPYFVPNTILDVQSDLTSLLISLLNRPEPPPARPPRADLIAVSAPDTEGYATVTGTPGSVEPLSAVVVINLNAHTLAVTVADASGSFTANLYAPPGSSLLVKYDPKGDQVSAFWAKAHKEAAGGNGVLNSLPGTILNLTAPLAGGGDSQDFSSVGAFFEGGWAGWWLSGTLQVPSGDPGFGLPIQAGQSVTLTATLRVTTPASDCTEPVTFNPSIMVKLLDLFAADGHTEPWGIWFTDYMFTPTGLPIEREMFGVLHPVGSADFSSLTCVSQHAFEALLDMTFQIPASLPDGIYLPTADIQAGGVPLDSSTPQVAIWYHYVSVSMPLLVLGAPAAPHIPWTLLGDYPVNGHRGVGAREDEGQFAMPTRVVTVPRTVVIPRLDERTGEPLAYRLEPGSHWLSATDRRQPNPPHIPLALPSGMLTVQVRKPDDTTDTLGPAVIQQSSVRTPTTPGGWPIDSGTGHIGDLYHLRVLDDAFDYSFDQYGAHVITISGSVDDVYGNTYSIAGTYDVTVARILDIDPAQLPTTPYEQGNAFAPGLHVFPPVPADVTVELVQMPYSDPSQAVVETITGQANRFGYFQPPAGTEIRMRAPGEFRVDIAATYTAPDGTLWMGAMTWGNVVEGPAALIEAHGRRTMDPLPTTADMPSWYKVFDLASEKRGIEVDYPYFSGDIHWGDESRQPGDSIQPIVTVKDKTPGQRIYNVMRTHANRPGASVAGDLETMLAVGEAPLFTTTSSGVDAGVAPEDVDLWAYWYGSSQRPDVRVREVISIEGLATGYWRFGDTYGYQIGEGAAGDLPGDLKWEFGGAVFRTLTDTDPLDEYAIYSSLWVLLPHGDPDGARIAPPFQDATGASINGGPIMTLKGEDIDMLFLPKGVRPGDILEVGDVVAFSGHVGPPLDSQVSVTVTAPSGAQRSGVWHANKIGWMYDPGFDFVANEAGVWTVDVGVLHDRAYVGNGVIPQSHNTGTVLGSGGQYAFYVVQPDSPRLCIISPQPGFITWPSGEIEPVTIEGVSPPGTSAVRYTVHDKGVVMEEGSIVPQANGGFTLTYDAEALSMNFPFVSLVAHEGGWEGLADEVAINLLAVGDGEARGNTVTLIGEEVFIGEPVVGCQGWAPTPSPAPPATHTSTSIPAATHTGTRTPTRPHTFTPTPSAVTTPTAAPSNTATRTLTPDLAATVPAATQSPTASATIGATPSVIPSPQPGDANCDEVVSAADLPALLMQLATSDFGSCGITDVNQDGLLTGDDIEALIAVIFE